MVNAIGSNLGADLDLNGGVSRDMVLDFNNTFRSEMADLMYVLMDPEADLELNGFNLEAEAKNGAAGSYLINQWLEEQNFIFSQLLESYKFQQTMDKQINNISF